ncbi:dihydrodipicolinate synthase family protein [Methylophaga thiooxydans]|uniref:dihydrodipicolinate synthase family protein n=1 Tax=Methylophaga thiooxydans TaxID=392484 RepID=UPI00235662BC|nr:dihydrodipicolinate synthase family protein [Methylophaga thiooxydans]
MSGTLNVFKKNNIFGTGNVTNQFHHSGLISYPVTPFDELNLIDFASFEALLHHLLSLKPNAICVLGSVGESTYLSLDESKDIIDSATNKIGGACPLFVGINTNNTNTAIELANYAKEKGAYGIMVSPFSYIPLKESELFTYFKDIALNVGLPIILYNNPISSGYSLSPEFMTYLANEIEEIQFIKDSSGEVSQLESLLALTAESPVKIFNGSNKIAFEALKMGVDGWCTVTPCFLGQHVDRIISHVRNGSQVYSNQQIALFKKLFLVLGEKGLIQSSKVAITHKVINSGKPRPPLQALAEIDEHYLIYLLDLISVETSSITHDSESYVGELL